MIHIHTGRPDRRELLLLAGVLLLAVALRMVAPGISEFKYDEAVLSRMALDVARGKSFPLLGMGSSVGIPNLPVSVWLYAVPYFFSADPILATLFTGALNVIAVAMTWALARRYFGPWAAIAAALLYAASPWGVIYSRKIWAQNLLPPFVVAMVGAGMIGFLEERQEDSDRWRIAHLLLLPVMVGIHYAAAALVPLSLGMIAAGWGRMGRRMRLFVIVYLLAGVAAAIGAGITLINWGFAPDEIIDQADSLLSGDSLAHFGMVITGQNSHSLAGAAYSDYLEEIVDIDRFQALLGGGILLSAFWLAYKERGEGRRIAFALAAWMLLPPLVFITTWTESFPHYMIPAMPPAFILAGAGIFALWKSLREGRWPMQMSGPVLRRSGVIFAALLVFFAASQAYNTFKLYEFVDTHIAPRELNSFGVPLHKLLTVRDAVRAREPEDVLIATKIGNPRYDEDAAVWSFLFYDGPNPRPLNARQIAVVSPGSALLIVPALDGADGLPAPNRCAEWMDDVEAFEMGGADAQICTQTDELSAMLPGQGALPVLHGRFANGAQLVSAEITGADFLMLGWQSGGPLPDSYSLFAHFLDADGHRIGQVDRAAWPGAYWRAGDTLYHILPLPPDQLAQMQTLRVGMYLYLEGGGYQNIDVLDEAGNPAGQWIDLPFPKE